MKKRHSRSRTRGPLAVALLLLLALLAHDLLMAAEPVDATAPPILDHSHGTAAGDSLPHHPTTCGVSQPAAPRLWSIDTLADAASVVNRIDPALDATTCREPSASLPAQSSGDRRALLQVYRL